MWREFEEKSPDLARLTRFRFEAHPHHVLGTITKSGAPRLSGINVFFNDGQMWFGSMPGTRKIEDLDRDRRLSVHSATLSETLDGGDARVSGEVMEIDPAIVRHWQPNNPNPGRFFAIDVRRVHLVEVRAEHLIITMWDEASGLRSVVRQ